MKKILLFAVILLTGLAPTQGQDIDLKKLKGMKPRSIGPAGMSGRVTAIDVDLSKQNRIIVGGASGGVWLSESGGINWKPIFDEQSVQAIGAIKINQKNPLDIWVGTGEGNPRNSLNQGNGIYRSRDGGKTWKHLGLEKTRSIHRIIIHRDNPDVVYVAAFGSVWGANKERGVYQTVDGGQTWKKILYVNEQTGIADMVVDPNNPNKIIAATWEYGRKPWTFNSGGPGSGIHITYDGGQTWKKITTKDGLPKGDLGRIGLAIAPSQPNIVYALIEAKSNSLHKSTDGGATWKLVSNTDKTPNVTNRPFYYHELYVDPSNENRIFSLWSYVSESIDGGKTFKVIADYGQQGSNVHPDHHAFWISPTDPDYLIEGNDGGLNISRDRGKNWRFVPNLPMAQFYHINYDMDTPYHVYGGMQDNGSWVGPAYAWKRGGIRNMDWREVAFGDGFDVVPNPSDSKYLYAMSQGGNVGYIDRETGAGTFVQPFHPDGTRLRFNWNAGIAQDPFDDCGAYFGSQFLHKTNDCGKSWVVISPDLTTNDTTKQKPHLSGGLTLDATQAENFTTILTIAPSPVDKNVIWVGTDDGNVQLTRDGGQTWTNMASKLSGLPKGSWIPQINASQANAGEALVVANDYRRNNWSAYVYKTSNHGATWTRIVDDRQVKGHVWSIVQDPIEPKLMFLGTDYGMYITFDGARNWKKWMTGYPSVPTADLKIHPREHDLIIGTFGRAAYILDDIRPLRAIAKTNGSVTKKEFAVFEAPDAYLANYRSVDGIRFTADGDFVGDNRRPGAMITVWNQPKKAKDDKPLAKGQKPKATTKDDTKKDKDKKGSGKKPDAKKAKVYVLNTAGDTIRTYSTKLDTGMTRIYWGLNEDGVPFPSYTIAKKDADIPGGANVLPGDYKVVVNKGKFKDSTWVTVKKDPRLDISDADLKAKKEAIEEMNAAIGLVAEAMKRLNEAKKTIKLVDESMVNAQDSIKTMIKDEGKAVADSIKVIQKAYSLAPGGKGITRNPEGLNSHLFTAFRHLRGSVGRPGPNAMNAKNVAESKMMEYVASVNDFFGNEWKEYQSKVTEHRAPLFKDYKDIKKE